MADMTSSDSTKTPDGASATDDTKLVQAYRQWRLPLMRFLKGQVHNPADAEDLTQEAFLRWAGRTAQPAPEQPRHLLYRIAINLLRDRSRRQQRRQDIVLPWTDEAEPSTAERVQVQAGASPEQLTEQRQQLERLDRVLASLPARQREALLLHRVEGLTQREIAERLGISRQMVVRHLSRALLACEAGLDTPQASDLEVGHD